MGESREVPLRRSLLTRLLVLVAVVALASTAATAWLTVRTTAVGIREEQGQALRADARIADALTAYAATHADWSAAGTDVSALVGSTGHRITLTDAAGRVLVDSSDSRAPLPRSPSAVIDALDTGTPTSLESPPEAACDQGTTCPVAPDAYVGPPPGDAPIDRRAVGPFALTDQERADSHGLAERLASCLRNQLGAQVRIRVSPSGRASLDLSSDPAYLPTSCDLAELDAPLPTEVAPLAALQTLLDGCLDRSDGPTVRLSATLGWTQRRPRTAASDAVVEQCRTASRREQLTGSVAPAATLYLSTPRQEATSFLDLSAENRRRIAEVALLVLVVCLGFAAVTARQLVRPLGALASAARRTREGDLSARADVRRRDEIGSVAAAFNAMAERREHSEELRRAMVGDVAHELRNPISTIRGSLEAAQDGLVETDAALVASLLEETLLLQHVVEDLRDLAAADAGDLRLTVETVDVPDLLGQVRTAHQRDADEAGVSLRVHAEPGLAVVGDPLRLRQLLGNLVGNAVRHTPEGGSVTVSGATDGTDGTDVVLTVTDTGEGIAAGDLEHVFDRFWRADPSRARNSGGSGLGLAITRQLAEAHGGTVTAASEVGAGASFVVRLPGRADGSAASRRR